MRKQDGAPSSGTPPDPAPEPGGRQPLDDLLAIMARLRDPQHGCPWDLQQDFASIAPYTIEEAYEVAEAIDRRDWADLRDELGDLLLQVVFHAQMAREAGLFDFADVAQAIGDKMRRRHPHVFGDARFDDAQAQSRAWESIKVAERAARGEPEDHSALAGISRGLPEYKRAERLQQRAAAVGFEWTSPAPVLDKLTEEIDEVRAEFASGADVERLEDEIGDVLFVVANLARQGGVDFSRALRRANAKFERRFRAMERLSLVPLPDDEPRPLAQRSLQEQERLWQRVKQEEAGGER